MKERLIISACLLGENCKYNGGNNYVPAVERLRERFELVPICPERIGGLPCPREPSERVGGKVRSRSGRDVTEAFRQGAEQSLAIARERGARRALLKERSPSCGFGAIYDGTFSGRVVPGSGMTAELLSRSGIKICGENGIQDLLDETGGS